LIVVTGQIGNGSLEELKKGMKRKILIAEGRSRGEDVSDEFNGLRGAQAVETDGYNEYSNNKSYSYLERSNGWAVTTPVHTVPYKLTQPPR